MPRRPIHEYNGPDQFLIEQLPPEFWTLMRSMLPMRKPTDVELRRLNWCEAATLCRELDGNGSTATDPWSRVSLNCSYLIADGRLHIGHIHALIHARTRCAISRSRTSPSLSGS